MATSSGGQPALSPEVKNRLEKAVLEVFSQADFHKANLRDVANRAGVSFATIYKYYGSKEALLFSFVDQWLGVLTERMIDHLKGIEDLKEKLRKVFWVQLDHYEHNPGLGIIIFMTVPLKTWMADDTFVQERMIQIYMEVLRQGQEERILNPAVPTRLLLDIMLGLVQRAFFMWVYRGQQGSLGDQALVLFEMLWRSLVNPERLCS
ncbi:MAG: TetR/AcrR family transcriptional regulator [Deltaproteobacteria bacterium]|nr:TetR/AcrR family transcriptional regulator [Deltaproteobacteria bacterium]